MSNSNLQFIIDRFYLNKFIKQLDIKNLLDLDLINNDYNIFKKKIYSPVVKITIFKISNILKKYINKPIITNEFIFALNLYKFQYKVLNNKNDIINIQELFELKLNLNNSVIEFINYLIKFNMYDELCILKFSNRYKKYVNSLNKWNNADKIKLIKTLFETYINLKIIKEEIINKKNNLNFKNEIKNLEFKQKKIRKEIYNYGGIENIKNVKLFSNFILKNYKFNDYLWELIDNDLKAIPIKLNNLVERITEIKYIIFNIVHKNKNLLKELEKTVYYKYVDCHYILTCLDFFFNTIYVIQYKYFDISDTYHNIFKQGLINGSEMFRFVPKCLKFLLNIYYKIWDDNVNKKSY